MHWNSLLQTFNVSNILRADGFSFVPPLCNQKTFRFRGSFRSGEYKRKPQKGRKERHTQGVLWHVARNSFFLFDKSNVHYTRDETTKISLLMVIILYVQEHMLYSSLYLAVKPRNIYNNNEKWNVQSIFIGSHASTHQSTECWKSREKKTLQTHS